MPRYTLILGTRNWSSWSLRPYVALRAAGQSFETIDIRLRQTEVSHLAAQVPSDAPHLLRFYQRLFRRQGSFPILERTLSDTAAVTAAPPAN